MTGWFLLVSIIIYYHCRSFCVVNLKLLVVPWCHNTGIWFCCLHLFSCVCACVSVFVCHTNTIHVNATMPPNKGYMVSKREGGWGDMSLFRISAIFCICCQSAWIGTDQNPLGSAALLIREDVSQIQHYNNNKNDRRNSGGTLRQKEKRRKREKKKK